MSENEILHGDVLNIAPTLPDNSISHHSHTSSGACQTG